MIVKTEKEFYDSLATFTNTITFDTETSGLDVWGKDRLCGIGICTSDEKTYYYPFRHKREADPGYRLLKGNKKIKLVTSEEDIVKENLPLSYLPVLLSKLEDADCIIGHNLKFDLAVAYQDGFYPRERQRLEDTIILARLKYCQKYDDLDLESVASKELKVDAHEWKSNFTKYLKENKIYPHYDYGEIDVVGEYCERDCLYTWKTRNALLRYIDKSYQHDVWNQEVNLTGKVIWPMERNGMFYDQKYCKEKIPLLIARSRELAEAIFQIFGYEFDIHSTPALGKAFGTIGIKSNKKTATGRDQWNLEVLLNLDHPVAKMVLQYRESYKMLNTYFLPYQQWANGWIHPSFKIHGGATGRMSCTNPNLQNVMTKPIDTAGEKLDKRVEDTMKQMSSSSSVSSRWIARITKFEEKDSTVAVKRLFIAPPKHKLYMADVVQMEMRFLAHYLNDPIIINNLEQEDFDFHTMVAIEVWKTFLEDPMFKFFRSLAKAVNFGMVYGIGDEKLAKQIGKSPEETQIYRKEYFERLPTARKFIQNVRQKIQNTGYITNFFGRRYVIPADKAYTGVNYLCQGGSADLIKNRMIAIQEHLTKVKAKTRMVCQIHDELLFYVADGEEELLPEIKTIFEERMLRVKMPIEFSRANPSWSEKIGICPKCWNDKIENKEEGIKHVC